MNLFKKEWNNGKNEKKNGEECKINIKFVRKRVRK